MRIYSVHDYSVDYKKCAQELYPKNDNNNARGSVIFGQESDLDRTFLVFLFLKFFYF